MPNTKEARRIVHELLNAIESMEFAPPEGQHLHQKRAAEALNCIAAALELRNNR